MQGVIQALLFEIIPLLHQAPYTGQKGYEWLRKNEEAEAKSAEAKAKSAAIALKRDILLTHEKFEKQLLEEEHSIRKAFLIKSIAALKRAMEEDQ